MIYQFSIKRKGICQNKYASYAEKKEKLLGQVQGFAVIVVLFVLNALNIVISNVQGAKK